MSFQSHNSLHAYSTHVAQRTIRRETFSERLAALIVIWRGRVEARRYLAEMDARSLREAGISPAAAAYECGKPFWKKMGMLR